jgi:predicted secreted protein
MPTTAPASGKLWKLKIAATSTTVAVVNLRSNDLDISVDMEEVSTKDSAEFKEYLPRFADGKIAFEGVYTQTASSTGFEDLQGWQWAKTLIYWELSNATASTPKFTGTGYIDSLKLSGQHDQSVMFSGSIQNTGDPAVGTVAP